MGTAGDARFLRMCCDRRVLPTDSENRGVGVALSGQVLFMLAFGSNPPPRSCPGGGFTRNRSSKRCPARSLLGIEIRCWAGDREIVKFSGFCARPPRSVVVCRDCRVIVQTSVDYGFSSGIGVFGGTLRRERRIAHHRGVFARLATKECVRSAFCRNARAGVGEMEPYKWHHGGN